MIDRHRRWRLPPLVLLCVTLPACGPPPTPQVARQVGGHRVVGTFVSPHSYEWYVRAELARARGDLAAAAQAYEMARAGPEEDPLVLARLATVLEQLGRAADADDVLEEGVELFPDAEALWLASGKIAEQRGQTDVALSAYGRAITAAPTSEQGPLLLSRLLRSQGAHGRADAILRRFTRNNEGSAGALRGQLELALSRDDATGAARAMGALLAVAPARTSDMARLTETVLDSGRPALAAGLLEALPPGSIDVRLRFRALLEGGRRERAEALLSTTRPEDVGGPLGQARLFLAVGRPDRALEIAESVMAMEPLPEAWLVAGLAHEASDAPGEAARLLVRVPRGARGFAEARAALAAGLARSGLRGAAREVLRDALEGADDDALLLREALARLRAEDGDLPGALASFGELDTARVRARKAQLLERWGRTEDALSTWRSIAPNGRDLSTGERLRAQAERLADAGHLDRAIELLSARSAWASDELYAKVRLAEMLLARGRRDEARDLARDVLRHATSAALRQRLEAIARP